VGGPAGRGNRRCGLDLRSQDTGTEDKTRTLLDLPFDGLGLCPGQMPRRYSGIYLVDRRLSEGVGEPRRSYMKAPRRIADDGSFRPAAGSLGWMRVGLAVGEGTPGQSGGGCQDSERDHDGSFVHGLKLPGGA